MKLIGPFKQILTLANLPVKGALKDKQLEVVENGGIICKEGVISEVGDFQDLWKKYNSQLSETIEISEPLVLTPGFIDAHTHICFAGSRSKDFAARNDGKTYQQIAAEGGGIWSTVLNTRNANQDELTHLLLKRLNQLKLQGITTVEVKSGYGLSAEHELKMLRAIKSANIASKLDLISTCLAAHIIPKDFSGSESDYLAYILEKIVPVVIAENLSHRFDIFIEENAFSIQESFKYLQALKQYNFDLTVHGDQFTTGGSQVAIDCKAISVDHLEVSGANEIQALAMSDVCPVALPGASMGLGCDFTPCRKLLDAGCSLVIASDWNPGSAPMGQLLVQASVLASYEKISAAEVFAGITFRAAKALNLHDRGIIKAGYRADLCAFPCEDYREILYNQGSLRVIHSWKSSEQLF